MHIFYCHSPITLLLATSVIKHLNLDDVDVHIIWGRGYQWNQIPYASTLLSNRVMRLADVPSYGEKGLITKYQQELSLLDDLFANASKGHSYTLYLPSTRNFLMQACATHPLVSELHFIEEGLMTYTGKYLKETGSQYRGFSGGIKSWLKRDWHGGRSFYYKTMRDDKECCRLYSINPKFHQEIESCSAVIVPLSCSLLHTDLPEDVKHIFVFDAIAEFGYCSNEALLDVFSYFLNKIFDKTQLLTIRFHPAQKIQAMVIELLNTSGVGYKIDTGNVPLELFMLKRKDLILYGFHSSLLFYGTVFGVNSFSLAKILAEKDVDAKKWYETTMPHIFYEKLNFYEVLK